MSEGVVAVVGATGYTGRLVVAEAQRLDLPVVAVGRNADGLHLQQELWEKRALHEPPLEIRVADTADPGALRHALRGAKVVVACAGPYSDVGAPVVAATLDVGAHYVDIAGEQAWIRGTAEEFGPRYLDARRVELHAMAFEVAVADFAAAAACEGLESIASIEVAYSMSKASASRGTRRSILRSLERGWAWQDGGFVAAPPVRARQRITFPQPVGDAWCIGFPGAEALTIPRHLDVPTCSVWMRLGTATSAMAWGLSPVLGPAMRSPLGTWLRGRAALSAPGPGLVKRQGARFFVMVQVTHGGGVRRATVSGRDPYGLTGLLAAEAAGALLHGEHRDRPGYRAPAELWEARPFLARLGRFGVELSIEDVENVEAVGGGAPGVQGAPDGDPV